MVCTSQPGLKEEEDHIRQGPFTCYYPSWTLNKLQTKINHKFSTNQAHVTGIGHQASSNNSKTNNHNTVLVVPYTKGLSESFRKVCNKVDVKVYFRGNNTIHNLLVAFMNKDSMAQNKVIFQFKCIQVDCDEEYNVESGGTFVGRH